jgi:hypothetical protein
MLILTRKENLTSFHLLSPSFTLKVFTRYEPWTLIWTVIIGTKGKEEEEKSFEKIPLCMCTRAFGLWKLHSLRVSKLPLKWRDWKLLMAQASMIECKLGAFWCGPPVNTVEILLQRIRFVAPVLRIGYSGHNCWVSCNVKNVKA